MSKKMEINLLPRGLQPKWLHDESRMLEIIAAVNRYLEEGMKIPPEWIEEYNVLAEAYRERQK